MKKIKRKKKPVSGKRPNFVVGFSGEDPPPGFLAAWYNQLYGGPLHIRFVEHHANSPFEVHHVDWYAVVAPGSPEEVEHWKAITGWEHGQIVQIMPHFVLGNVKQDVVLFVARLAKGLTILTEGTAYDVLAVRHFNPSDWSDRLLQSFFIEDHVQVLQEEHLLDGRQWIYTRGLSKFGLEEFETFLPRGLSGDSIADRLLALGDECVRQGKSPRVGEHLCLTPDWLDVHVVNHRTHASPQGQLNLREVQWDMGISKNRPFS